MPSCHTYLSKGSKVGGLCPLNPLHLVQTEGWAGSRGQFWSFSNTAPPTPTSLGLSDPRRYSCAGGSAGGGGSTGSGGASIPGDAWSLSVLGSSRGPRET